MTCPPHRDLLYFFSQMSVSAERVTAEACAQANVMGIISGNQCILSHLKASEPFVAFLSHEVPLCAERNRTETAKWDMNTDTQTRVCEHRTLEKMVLWL